MRKNYSNMDAPLKPVYQIQMGPMVRSMPAAAREEARRKSYFQQKEEVKSQNKWYRQMEIFRRQTLQVELEDYETRRNVTKEAATVIAKIIITLLAVFGYCMLGAYTFMALEQSNEKQMCLAQQKLYDAAESNYSLAFWKIGLSFGSPDEESQAQVLEIIRKNVRSFKVDVIMALRYDGINCSILGEPGGPEYDFNFRGSFLLCLTAITTIGYGIVTPHTAWGRITMIMYCMVGIPIVFVFLAVVGEVMASVFRFTYSHICCLAFCAKKKKPKVVKERRHSYPDEQVLDDDDDEDDDDDDDDEIPVPMTVTLLVIGAYIVMGTIVFAIWEDWDYLKSAYYCFITIATIGFGDVVPGIFDNDPEDQVALKTLVSCLYIVIGLALMAMGIDLIQYEMAKKMVSMGGVNVAKAGDTVDEIVGKSEEEIQHNIDTWDHYRGYYMHNGSQSHHGLYSAHAPHDPHRSEHGHHAKKPEHYVPPQKGANFGVNAATLRNAGGKMPQKYQDKKSWLEYNNAVLNTGKEPVRKRQTRGNDGNNEDKDDVKERAKLEIGQNETEGAEMKKEAKRNSKKKESKERNRQRDGALKDDEKDAVKDGKSDSNVSDNKAIDNKASDNKVSDNKASDNKASDNKVSDNKVSDNKVSDNKASDNKASDNKVSDNKVSDNKASDNKGSDKVSHA